MASVQETSGAKTPLGASLADGLNTISLNQTLDFTMYVKMVLPLDGYVFWVNANLLSDSAIYNATQYNLLVYGQPPRTIPPKKITS